MDEFSSVTLPQNTPELKTPPSGLGRLVLVADVAPYAKQNCKSCHGLGFAVIRFLDGSPKTYKPCGCAIRRFNKQCNTLVETVGEEIRWKPGKSPRL